MIKNEIIAKASQVDNSKINKHARRSPETTDTDDQKFVIIFHLRLFHLWY